MSSQTRMQYFISYHYERKDGNTGFSSTVMNAPDKIMMSDDILGLMHFIAQEGDFADVQVLNFIFLGEVEVNMEEFEEQPTEKEDESASGDDKEEHF